MADVLIVAETRDGRIIGASREATAVAAGLASSLGGRAEALVVGGPDTSTEATALGRFGAATITLAEHEALADYQPEAYADVVVERVRAGDYAAVLFSATTLGKDLAPRVAALLDVPLACDATAVEVEEGTIVIERPVYAGKAFARLEIETTPVLMSLRPNAFPAAETGAEGKVQTFTPHVDPSGWKVRVVERQQARGGTLDVSAASIIVSGGRGMKDPSNWKLLEELRDAIGAGVALGASRAVVDAGWRPHGEQVGQTGKTVAPTLYFAVGISGAIQHLAGMRTAKTIVAINRDADAPIFNVADYGIVGDLFEILPRLTVEVAALKAGD
jgi:electron transfer flavoprotein alpha subunit